MIFYTNFKFYALFILIKEASGFICYPNCPPSINYPSNNGACTNVQIKYLDQYDQYTTMSCSCNLLNSNNIQYSPNSGNIPPYVTSALVRYLSCNMRGVNSNLCGPLNACTRILYNNAEYNLKICDNPNNCDASCEPANSYTMTLTSPNKSVFNKVPYFSLILSYIFICIMHKQQ
uniref:Uncharacterized protein n=1 Tax=Acrobeloides nanus TaxID=290746 RepID=A0A914DRV0_9BILA